MATEPRIRRGLATLGHFTDPEGNGVELKGSVADLGRQLSLRERKVAEMEKSPESFDVVVLGAGIAGLAGALAAERMGLRPVVLEKANQVGGITVHSYGFIWIGLNHLAAAQGLHDDRDDVLAYMRFIGGGQISEDKMVAFVDRSPEALKFF